MPKNSLPEKEILKWEPVIPGVTRIWEWKLSISRYKRLRNRWKRSQGYLRNSRMLMRSQSPLQKRLPMKAIKKRMEKDVDEVGKIARNVKAKLEAINRDNLANRQKPGCEKGTGVDRSRTNMTNALTKKFKELMSEFQVYLSDKRFKDEYREVVERRVITVTGTRPDEETIDRLIETGDSEQIFQKAIQEMGRGQVLDTLEEIQERHDAVKEIEKKLLDLHQVYLDMAVLVEAQGELLDNIENQVTNAVDHVQWGTDALRTAKSLQKKSRKCMMIAIILVLIIALIIVLSILKPWKKN
ncbi:hypothetical protein L1049_024444 [Liquidambar formosana]|uniref:t-SNARE coiled-coil homology domain-containing protein n=1 Tax=Liquidambar formosana TaxID=63359 RepID=A0AAP0RW23_LIQFO